jgi:hypothetical protein
LATFTIIEGSNRFADKDTFSFSTFHTEVKGGKSNEITTGLLEDLAGDDRLLKMQTDQ